MRAFLSIKYHDNHQNRPLIETISSAFADMGIEIVCIVRDIEQWGTVHISAAELMKKTFEVIDSCAFVLVDVTEKGVGIGIEAGYAYAKKKPIFTIASVNADISETLKGISTKTLRYNELADLSPIADQLRHAAQSLRNSIHPVLYLSLMK